MLIFIILHNSFRARIKGNSQKSNNQTKFIKWETHILTMEYNPARLKALKPDINWYDQIPAN